MARQGKEGELRDVKFEERVGVVGGGGVEVGIGAEGKYREVTQSEAWTGEMWLCGCIWCPFTKTNELKKRLNEKRGEKKTEAEVDRWNSLPC